MLEICTIGFTRKSARDFFGLLRDAGVRRIVDVRISNTSQLAAYTKRADLAFFVEQILDGDYVHEPLLAPSPELFTAYKKRGLPWGDYEPRFLRLLEEREIEKLDRALFEPRAALLCSEPTPERCHRRLVAEYLQRRWGRVAIRHL